MLHAIGHAAFPRSSQKSGDPTVKRVVMLDVAPCV
jgi:hypothetical protein